VAVRDGKQNRLSQEFQTHADGRVEMRLETTGRKELVRWILSWMPDVKVLAPKSLRDRIAEKLQDGLRTQEQDWIASVPQKKD
jgi:predicted DNA-binding transcriptional regulator YafY